jgi:hypothetical protein
MKNLPFNEGLRRIKNWILSVTPDLIGRVCRILDSEILMFTQCSILGLKI